MRHINDSKTTNIVNEYGENVTVNWNGEVTLMNYDNNLGFIEWNVPYADNSHFHTDVLVAGKVESVKERLHTWNNVPKVVAALFCMNLDSEERETIEESVAECVIDNQQFFFTKCGNWRKNNRRQQENAVFETCKKAYKQLKEGK